MRETPLYLQGPLLGMLTAWSQDIIGLSMFGAGVVIEMMEPRMLGLVGGAGFDYFMSSLLLVFTDFSDLRSELNRKLLHR